MLARAPHERELPVLTRELARRAVTTAIDVLKRRWLAHGQSRPGADLDVVELAAYTVVANLILNLDEAITRE